MTDVAAGLHAGLTAGGVRHALYVPDSVMMPLTKRLDADPAIATVVCAREDEAVAIATGLFVAGAPAAVAMEASGIGYCGLILARAQLQRTPLLILASHGGGIGEQFDYHEAPAAAGRGVISGLGIDQLVLQPGDDPAEIVRLALQTIRGQRRTIAIFIPPYVMRPERPAA